ncbi:hypothetical protein TNCV_4319151 [Trichonephila clavipes]|nr:hypothetical protein TNCV_4319151 [Trichonephila clavipes]
MATPTFYHRKMFSTCENLNSVKTVPICLQTDVLCKHKKSSENRPIKKDLGARNKFAYDRVKIPITERRSPDIQRRKPIKYQAGMRSRHSRTRTCRRYGSSWESSR